MIKRARTLSHISERLTHGFFPMETDDHHSLSASFTDNEDKDEVTARRDFMMKHLSPTSPPTLVTCKQIHSNIVHVVDTPWSVGDAPRADGLVTNKPGIALGILTADCGPILFVDSESNVIGACHAGWKGAALGILENTITAMEGLGAKRSRIIAALGPTIQAQDYEVGPEFPLKVLRAPQTYSQFFTPSTNLPLYHHFDLPHYLCSILTQSGIKTIEDLNINTLDGPYFSRRRTVKIEGNFMGFCNLSCIAFS